VGLRLAAWLCALLRASEALLLAQLQEMASLLTTDQQKQLRQIFGMIDSDNNGKLNTHELMLIVNSFGQPVSETEIQDIVAEIDVGPTGGDGRVDFEEFVSLFVRRYDHDKKIGFSKSDDAELKEAFAALDASSKDGVLSAEDLKKAFDGIGEPESSAHALADLVCLLCLLARCLLARCRCDSFVSFSCRFVTAPCLFVLSVCRRQVPHGGNSGNDSGGFG
jgi:Ca2+-binding EF-hand superfamily protein